MKIKSITLTLVLAGLMLAIPQIALANDDNIGEAILELLLDKDIISQDELDKIKREAGARAKAKERAESRQAKTTYTEPYPGETNIAARVERLEKYVAYDFQPNRLRGFWKDRLSFVSDDGSFDIGIGARMMSDYTVVDESEGFVNAFSEEHGEVRDGGELREARISVLGKAFTDYEFKLQIDFLTGDPEVKDAYVQHKNLPYIGTLRVGQFKLPVGLENNTSKRFITFMERAQERGLFTQRELGVMAFRTFAGNRIYAAAGLFTDISDEGNPNLLGGGDYMAAARITALPIYEDGGRKLLHTGVSYTYASPNENETEFQERPEVHILPRYIETGKIKSVDNWNRWGAEVAGVWGPLSAQAEWVTIDIEGLESGSVNGYYAYASYCLTGEHRRYDTELGEFIGIKPNRDFNLRKGGLGAWEIAARYSTMDLNDRDLEGGEQNITTLGLNWYLNESMRIMFNYETVEFPGVSDADLNVFKARFQLSF